MLNPRLTERAAEFWTDRQLQQFNDAADAEAERAELVAQIKKEKLDAKLAALPIADLMDGAHAIDEMDCGVLRAAWRVSDESLGKHFRQFVIRQMNLSAELEAEKSADSEV
ncbi:hypothetical protein [Burkholderia vietnamiensis]|uniref:hypothetical protein n=1 Tax=Burkholderia vietnamiensis TaxID=60552 RepID=UPI001B9A71EE|nr:hypothetical protein [Burkholderia vietnamiensis]MBR8147048.1 hypothetical protein [Burkholderia vietnamiensis]